VTPPLRGARAVQVAAQAKVNLRLRILAREASGYHQIETLFLRLTLADVVRVRRARSRTLETSGNVDVAAMGPTEKNLAWRAALAYGAAASMRDGFAIELEKLIPIGGGLGGGSADAGAVLRALDAMAESPLGERRLLEIAATLGADVPFLTSEHAYALAWGRGERMLALHPPPAREVLLLIPPFSVNTADAYGWLAAARTAADVREGGGREPLTLDPASLSHWETIQQLATNDFQPVVIARHPEIADIIAGLTSVECAVAMMSGSGSTVFAVPHSSIYKFWVEQPGGGAEPASALQHVITHSATRVEPVLPLD
jgi:4-diphosphocytidyl-2-C-methyl-D-erythritol kinase